MSIDGPADMHNTFRKDKGGVGTFGRSFAAYVLLKEMGVQVGVSAVINSVNVTQPERFYRFFRQHFRSFSFTPCFSPIGVNGDLLFPIQPEQYADFFCSVFNLWWKEDNPSVRVRTLYSYVEAAIGKQPYLCSMSNGCWRFLEIDADGTVYPCGRMSGYSGVDLGNLRSTPLDQILTGSRRQEYLSKALRLSDECQECPWLCACHNGCSFHKYLGEGMLAEKTPACEAIRKIMVHIQTRVQETQRALAE